MRINYLRLLLYVFIVFLYFPGVQSDESLLFQQISTHNGLSQNTVRSLLVDSKGFIWAGTLDGLNRYDGSRFVIYKPDFGKNPSLNDHRIRSIYEDKTGFLWVKKYDNTASCYNPFTESFINIYNGKKAISLDFTNLMEASDSTMWLWDSRNGCIQLLHKEGEVLVAYKSPASSVVKWVFEDSHKKIWIGLTKGIILIDKAKKPHLFYNKDNSNNIRRIAESGSVVYFLTEQSTILRYDLRKKAFLQPIVAPKNCTAQEFVFLNKKELLLITRNQGVLLFNVISNTFNLNPFPENKKLGNSTQFITDSKGGIWFYDHTGILRHYIPKTGKLKELNLLPPNIIEVIDNERYSILIDAQDNYWITTYGNGLFRYDPIAGKLENFRFDDRVNSPASNYLLAIAEDFSGNIWLGSEYSGIIKVVKQKYKIEYIRPEIEKSPGSSNNVKVVFEDSNDNVWVGTKNGSIYLYDKSLKSSRCVQRNLNPYTIMEDHKKRIWIGTKGNGVYVYDILGRKEIFHFQNDENNPGSLNLNSIFNILQDRHNRIWIATFGGGLDLLTDVDKDQNFKHFFYNKGNQSFIRYLYEDRVGNIWAGSYGGLISFYPQEFISNPERYRIYNYNSDQPEGLNCNDIKTIFEDSKNRLWVGTAGGGLNLLVNSNSRNKGSFIKFTKKQGLPSDIVTDILESRDKSIWIGTESGIARYNEAQKTFMTYLFSENTHANYYSENAGTLRTNGDMLWGTLDGFIAFNPQRFILNNYAPAVVLTDLYIFDQRAETYQKDSPLEKSIGETKNLVLDYNQNTFTLYFSNLNLTNPAMNKYSYIMEPFEQYWSAPGSNNSATYKNLPPGEYTFIVKGANADGQWCELETVLSITVKPPFWKSTFAKVMYSVILLLILGGTFYTIAKITRLNNLVRVEKQLTDYKLSFFTNISHEFRTPLTLIRAAVESLTDQDKMPSGAKKHIDLLNRNTHQMSRLIDQLLEFRKIQNNILTLNLELTEITDYVLSIYFPFKEIAAQKNIDYQFTVLTEKWEMYIDRNKVEKILFNLLSNAFKFTPSNGRIELVLEKGTKPDTCKISVKDNGIGIPKEKQSLLFSRFMQIHFSAEGTGVGLSLVKEFSEAHKGKVWFEENTGGGAVFSVELPATSSEYKDARYIDKEIDRSNKDNATNYTGSNREESEISSSSVSHEYKILVIDDNKDIRDFLSDELGNYFTVETAENGALGLEKAINTNPDLVICDVKMPLMDGFEVTSHLKNEFQTSHIPIILLTALSSESVELASSECGADAYIMKPFSFKYLLSRVFKLIEQREKLKKRFSIDINVNENLLSGNNRDKDFYNLLTQIIEEHMSDPKFSVEEFTELSGQKRTIFYKKVKGLTGYSPNDLIKIKRMKKAAELLLEGKLTVAEVSWKVGIDDQFYFSKCFKAQFGCSPSKYGKTNGLTSGLDGESV